MYESGFADFLSQLPPIASIMFCISGIALVGAVVATFIVRSRKMRRLEALVAATGTGTSTPGLMKVSGGSGSAPGVPPGDSDPSLDDLPDLDVLTAPARPAHSGAFGVRLTDGTLTDAVEVLTVLRDIVDGSLIVQLGERAYRYPVAPGADVEITRRIATVRDALGGQPAASAPLATDDSPPTPSLGDLVAARPPIPRPVALPTQTVVPGSAPGDLPKFKMPDQYEAPKRFARVKRPDEVIPDINIAAAIEDYLQYRLVQTGALPGRSVHIRNGVKGGISIEIDGRFFEAVGDVDDAEVRAFLQASIEEWQDRQG